MRHVLLSVHVKQLCYHWKDFYEIWYFSILRKSVGGKFKFDEIPTRITD